jgi:urease accessory protein
MVRTSLYRFGTVAMLAAMAVILAPRLAFAHVGVSPAHDLLHGLEHPLTGLDHILAMFAVGLWAAQRGGRALWLVPLTFIGIMTVGGALGMSHVSVPFAEEGIVLSVITLGIFVAMAARLPLGVSAVIVGVFALAHGYAHGVEIPSSASGISYALGFAAATALLHGAGIGLGLALERVRWTTLVRLAGVAIAVCGLCLGIA